MEIVFGSTVKDRITGFQGVVAAHVTRMTGSAQYLVEPHVTEPSKFPDGQWLDADRVELVPQAS